MTWKNIKQLEIIKNDYLKLFNENKLKVNCFKWTMEGLNKGLKSRQLYDFVTNKY